MRGGGKMRRSRERTSRGRHRATTASKSVVYCDGTRQKRLIHPCGSIPYNLCLVPCSESCRWVLFPTNADSLGSTSVGRAGEKSEILCLCHRRSRADRGTGNVAVPRLWFWPKTRNFPGPAGRVTKPYSRLGLEPGRRFVSKTRRAIRWGQRLRDRQPCP